MLRVLLVLLLVCIAGGFALAWRSAIPPVDPQNRPAFEPALVKRGEALAQMGNCATCHTRPGGKQLEGGLALPTPFGTIYSTNITPDPETGVGRWPEAAFARAMREGVNIDGQQLYPAFPYDHFTLMSDEDIHALYGYVMTREPVKAPMHANELTFPFNFRPAIAFWKVLYFREGRYRPDAAQSSDWNRGAYLTEGVAHCGGCHTPRGSLGAEKKDDAFSGAPIEGWYAYAINAASPAPLPWTQEALEFYLSNGWQEHHGVARGPMAPVVMNLASVPRDEVKAIATYIAAMAGKTSTDRERRGEAALKAGAKAPVKNQSSDSLASVSGKGTSKSDEGAFIYAGACASCHESGRALPYGGLNFSLSTAVNGPDPSNIINVTLYGLSQKPGNPGPIMPGFRGSLTNVQMIALLKYLRANFSSKPPWPDLEREVQTARDKVPRLWPTPSSRPVVATSSQEVRPW